MSNAALPNRPRVLFFGMQCAFSAPPLAALIEAGCDLRALVLPAPRSAPALRWRPGNRGKVLRLPVAGAISNVDELADRAGVPIMEVADLRSGGVITALRELEPDLIAVACFPWLIPAAVRELPRLGCLNAHPSLLPRWRGPEPLFWTFKAGDAESGATVHLLDGGFDSGPIVAQRRVQVPRGVDGRAFERELAALGGTLLLAAISGLADGTVTAMPQDETRATLAPMPTDEDLVVRSDQPASRMVDLVRGIVPLWGPLTVRVAETGTELSVGGAVSFDSDGDLPMPVVLSGHTVRVRCSPGVATLTLTPTITDESR